MQRVWSVVLLLHLAATAVNADWAARERRPEETASLHRFYTAVGAALPAGPDGWRLVERYDTVTSGMITEGAEDAPLRWEYLVRYEDSAALAAAEAQTQAALAALPQRSAGERYAALAGEYTRLADASGEALNRGAMGEVEQLMARLDELAREIDALGSADQGDGDRVIAALAARDARLSVRVTVNEDYCAPGTPLVPDTAVAGLTAWRAGEPGRMSQAHWEEGVTVVTVGRWRAVAEEPGVLRAALAAYPSTVLQTVLVSVRGDRARARAYLERIDWARLQELVDRR